MYFASKQRNIHEIDLYFLRLLKMKQRDIFWLKIIKAGFLHGYKMHQIVNNSVRQLTYYKMPLT